MTFPEQWENLSLADLKDKLQKDVSAERALEIEAKFRAAAEKATGKELAAGAVMLLMGILMDEGEDWK